MNAHLNVESVQFFVELCTNTELVPAFSASQRHDNKLDDEPAGWKLELETLKLQSNC